MAVPDAEREAEGENSSGISGATLKL